MAAMPSVGGIQKLSMLVLAVAILGVTASSASAAPVWVWACQGPNGQTVETSLAQVAPPTGDGSVESAGAGCGGGVSLGFTRTDPIANSSATVRISLPSGLRATQVRVLRNGTGFGAAPDTYRFSASLDGHGTLEQVNGNAALVGETTFNTNGSGALTFSLSCTSATESCATGAPRVEIERIAVLVDDTVAPRGAVGWNSPVDKSADLKPSVSDEGVGLERIEAVISAAAGAPALVTASVPVGACADLTPGDATNDRALSAACVTTHTVVDGLSPDTSLLLDGKYWRTVTVYDAAGNASTLLDQEFEVFHPNLGTNVQTLSIGSSGVDIPLANPSPGPGGGTQGAQSTSCRSPRLSVSLGSKPLRISKGRPLLLANKRYRFEGRLTCVVNGKRRSAPKSTRIEILNKVGRKTVSKPATRLRAGGKLNALLKTPNVSGTRTLIFRYRNASGQRVQVSIRVTITKRAPKR